MKQKKTLRSKFLKQMIIILVFIMLISGLTQLYFINQQLKSEVETQANIISTTIIEGINETGLASEQIEDQIGGKLSLHAEYIASLIEDEGLAVSNSRLGELAQKLGLAGITLFAPKGDDIIGIKAARPEEIGFSFKQYGYLSAGEALLNGEQPDVPGASSAKENMLVLPIAQAGSVKDKPVFFKFAYYHPPGKSYIISVYLPANEVYEFTSKVGPEQTIEKMLKQNPNIINLAVLDPSVFQNPDLEKQIYPPKKKVVYGTFEKPTKKDLEILKSEIGKTNKIEKITEDVDGEKLFKLFIPMMNDRVIYIALDRDEIIGPIYRHSIILLVTGFVSLFILFFLSARFFNHIYKKINMIKEQLIEMRNKNFTTKSKVEDDTEIGVLSESADEMSVALNHVLRSARNQANQTKRLSLLLEADISKSIQELYEISVDTTTKSREELETFRDIIESLRNAALSKPEELDQLWGIIQDKTSNTTEMTITLSDIIQSIHKQSSELSETSNELHNKLSLFKL